KRTFVTAFALVAVLLLPGRAPILAQDKPLRLTLSQQDVEETLGTDWFGVYIVGKKVGFAKFTLARTGEAKNSGYTATMDIQMTIVAGGSKQRAQFVETFDFEPAPPFALRRGSFTQTASNATQKTELTRTDQGFAVTRTADGTTTRKQLSPVEYTLTDELSARFWLKRGAKVGDRLTTRSFDFDKLQIDPESRKLLSTKTSLAKGVQVTFHEVEMTSAKLETPTLERYDGKGRFLSGKIGTVIEMRSESEQQAKNIDLSADLFVLGSVKIDRPLGQPS